jgi:hypothetical protein
MCIRDSYRAPCPYSDGYRLADSGCYSDADDYQYAHIHGDAYQGPEPHVVTDANRYTYATISTADAYAYSN